MVGLKIESNNSTASVEELKGVLKKELGDSVIGKLDDSILLRSLMMKQFDVAGAANLLKNHIELRRKHPEFFIKSLDEARFDNIFEKFFTVLRTRGANGECLFVCKVSDWDPDEVDALTMFAAVLFAFECLSLDMDIHQSGILLVSDTKGVGWKHVKALKPSLLQTHFRIILNSPVNLKWLLQYNINWAIDLMYRVISPILPKSIVDRVVLATETSKLGKYLGEDFTDVEKLKPTREDRQAFVSVIRSKSAQVFQMWAKLDQI